MKRFLFLFLVLIFVAGSISSCKRLGCQDTNSIKYDPDARKDDGSCVYEGTLIVWLSQFQSNIYVTAGITDLHFIINNELIGTLDVTDYSTTIPDCEAPSGFVKTMQIGKVASKNYTLIVRDDQDNFIVQKTFVIDGNGCKVVQI